MMYGCRKLQSNNIYNNIPSGLLLRHLQQTYEKTICKMVKFMCLVLL